MGEWVVDEWWVGDECLGGWLWAGVGGRRGVAG